MLDTLSELLSSDQLGQILRAALLFLVGFIVAGVVARGLFKLMARRANPHHATLVRRIVYWALLTLFFASALNQMGFSLGVLLGAAGVLTVAIGFASQTSASNLISGLFLVGEKPFQLGDVIKVGNTLGEVLSIDLLSVKLRTFDNLFVRIPNESLIKTEMTNLTRFPIRRFDLQIGVAYREDIARVRDVLVRAAHANPLALEEPEPLFIFSGFGDSSMNIQFSVWTKRENFLDLRNSLQEAIKIAFDAEGIEIPFPHRTLYAGSETEPFPVKIVAAGDAPAEGDQPGRPASNR